MFGKRLMSSVVLVVLALFLLLTGGGILALGMLILSLIAFRELTKACGVIDAGQKNNALEGVGYGGIILYYLVVYGIKDPIYWMGMLAVIFLGLMFVYVFSFPKFRAEQVMTTFFCAFYAPVLFTFIFLTRNLPNGIYMVWMIFISSWICDTCAYLSGMAIGKHKLAPVLRRCCRWRCGCRSGGCSFRMAGSGKGICGSEYNLDSGCNLCGGRCDFPGGGSGGFRNQKKPQYQGLWKADSRTRRNYGPF